MAFLKTLRCFFGHAPPQVSVADGIGGNNRYFLKECPRCGRQWWRRQVLVETEIRFPNGSLAKLLPAGVEEKLRGLVPPPEQG